MLFLLNSDYGAMKMTLKLNRFLATVSVSRHFETESLLSHSFSFNVYHRHVHQCSFGTVQNQESTILI